MRLSVTTASIFLAIGAVLGCARSGGPDQANPAAATQNKTAESVNGRLLDAAEPYEAITEASFRQPFADLVVLRSNAKFAAEAVMDALSAEDAEMLQSLDSEIGQALDDKSRSQIALAAVESYRVLVSAQDSTAVIPKEISLLDYAGFKYDALSRPSEPQWVEMIAAAAFAERTWKMVKSKVDDETLIASIEASMQAMQLSAEGRDLPAAQSAAARELDLVDELEQHFLHKQAR